MTQTDQPNVPKLRFPGFEGDWKATTLGPHLEQHQQRVPADTDIPVYSSSRSGLKSQKDYFAGDDLRNEGEYGVVPCGYFTYRHMSDDLTFKFNLNTLEHPIAVSKEYPVFQTVNLESRFLLDWLNNSPHFSRFAAQQKLGGTRTRLYFKNLKTLRIHLPTLPEQRKIASFLGAMDTKIAQLAEKTRLLEDYKKGCMQQLFSQKIRFKDDTGNDFPDWEEKRLGEVASYKAGHFVQASKISGTSRPDLYPCYGANGLRGYTESKTHSGLFPLIGRQGALCGNVQLVSGDFHATEHAIVVSPNKSAVTIWLFYELGRMALNRFATGQAQPGVSVDTIMRLKTKFPHPDEQRKIADFLSALDRKIDLVGKELDHARSFKQGLLQQMFV